MAASFDRIRVGLVLPSHLLELSKMTDDSLRDVVTIHPPQRTQWQLTAREWPLRCMQKFGTTRVCLVSTALSISAAGAHVLGGSEESLFHATALWQGGGNLRTYLGLLTSPSGMSRANTCNLDLWWIEKRRLSERVNAHLGQFARQDFRGAQHYSAPFIPSQWVTRWATCLLT